MLPSSRLLAALFRPIDIAWLIAFRVGAGWLLALEMAGSLALGYYREYTQPQFHFAYYGFGWLPHWSPAVIIGLHLAAIGAGVAVAAGWHYRVATPVLALSYVLLFLAEQTRYINHFYLYCLVACWLCLLPANRAFSADVRAGRVAATGAVPAWMRYLLLAQLSLVYLYAGLAKLNADWLLARPLTVWLAAKAHYPVLGTLLAHWVTPWLMSYAGAAFDLLVVPLMLWPRTRRAAFGLATVFHLTNVLVFGLGTFPWFSLMMTGCLFFPPAWPRTAPLLRRWLLSVKPLVTATSPRVPAHAPLLLTGLALYLLAQMLVPWRPLAYPGNVHWTEEGHYFSWHMMLRTKSGTVRYRVVDANGRVEVVDPATYLTPTQTRKLATHPDLLLQFAHFLAAEYCRRGAGPVRVFADSWLQLNRRPPRPLVSPTLDLAAQPRTLGPARWILPAPPLE